MQKEISKKSCLSGKNSYINEETAIIAAKNGMLFSKEKNLKLDTYYCLYCYHWHLTSSKKNK